jgi:uncharacterized protein
MMKQAVLLAAVAAAAFAASRAAAQAAPGSPAIRVSATGEVRAAPDQAVADFAVETVAATAQEAAAQNAQRMERVIAALVRAGVPRERIETRDYSVYPDYDHREGGEPRIRGYRVNNTVQATLHEVDGVGPVIDAALAAGANRVHGVRFGLRDPQAHRQRAIADAVRRARADAEAMAAALGLGLGMVREASTVEAGPVFPVVQEARMQMAGDAAMSPTPVSPGEQVVRATVQVVYAVVGL